MEQKLSLTSPSFQEGAHIPTRHTCDSANVSPPLEWTEPPKETRGFALIMDDPDAPSGTFTHWVLFDLPPDSRRLPEGEPGGGREGRNDFDDVGYGGPCPPRRGGAHRYFLRLYALDVETLGLEESPSRSEVEKALRGHVVAEDILMGLYERR